ncbi:MAG: glycosyltransferase [Lishizhenia sp.]
MKVLFTTHWYPNENNTSEGQFIKKHLSAIQENDVSVTLLVVRIKAGNSLFKRSTTVGEEKIEVVISSLFWKFLYLLYPIQRFFVWSYIHRQLKVKKFDLIHANVTHPNGVFAHYLSEKLKIPFVITEHHSQIKKYSKLLYTKKSFNAALKNAAAVTGVSNFLLDNIYSNSTRSKNNKDSVVGNIIDSSVFHFQDIKNDTNAKTVLCIGNWSPSKGNTKIPELILKSLKNISLTKRTQINLEHIGVCSIKQELKKEFETAHLRISFLGNKTPKQINEALNRADVFAHATRFETFCVVGVEAQKAGCPVLISNIKPLNTILNSYGTVFCENSAEDWERGFLEILEKEPDRKKISSEALSKFNAHSIGLDFIELYKKVLY